MATATAKRREGENLAQRKGHRGERRIAAAAARLERAAAAREQRAGSPFVSARIVGGEGMQDFVAEGLTAGCDSPERWSDTCKFNVAKKTVKEVGDSDAIFTPKGLNKKAQGRATRRLSRVAPPWVVGGPEVEPCKGETSWPRGQLFRPFRAWRCVGRPPRAARRGSVAASLCPGLSCLTPSGQRNAAKRFVAGTGPVPTGETP